MIARLALILFFFAIPQQQTRPARPAEPPLEPPEQERQQEIPSDIELKMAIERAESEHRKFLDYAKKLDELSAEVARRYREAGRLLAEDIKRLDSIEKMAKWILEHSGGERVEKPDGLAEINSLANAVDQLSAEAAGINKRAASASRFVVDAAIISGSNEIIQLVRFIRRSHKQSG
jgi:hypothetical protein